MTRLPGTGSDLIHSRSVMEKFTAFECVIFSASVSADKVSDFLSCGTGRQSYSSEEALPRKRISSLIAESINTIYIKSTALLIATLHEKYVQSMVALT